MSDLRLDRARPSRAAAMQDAEGAAPPAPASIEPPLLPRAHRVAQSEPLQPVSPFSFEGLWALGQRCAPPVKAVLLGSVSLVATVSAMPAPAAAQVTEAAPIALDASAVASHGFSSKVDRHAIGAYFRKVTSRELTQYRGIRVTGTLPQVELDQTRMFASPQGRDHYQTGPLDRPSYYLGGRTGGRESDVGLTWDRVYDAQGRATYTDNESGSDGRAAEHRFVRGSDAGQVALLDGTGKVVARGAEAQARLAKLQPNFAFRPYWRAIDGGKNVWDQPDVGAPDNFYYYPGEKITMSVQVTGPRRMRMDIRLEEGAVQQHFTHSFGQDGAGIGKKQSFKRVISIDQFGITSSGARKGREDAGVLKTATKVTGGGFDEAVILRSGGKDPLPMRGKSFIEVRGGDTAKNYNSIFKRYDLNTRGGERVDITPPH